MNDIHDIHQTHEPHKKSFSLAPPPEDLTAAILAVRLAALTDPELSDGAARLFVHLLDLSLQRSASNWRGQVTISQSKLSEHLHRSRRVIWDRVQELIGRRYVWITKQRVPNFWDLNVYHVTALDSPNHPEQNPTRDGLWGNGARRGPPPGTGMGARTPPGGTARDIPARETPSAEEQKRENAPESRYLPRPSAAKSRGSPPRKVAAGSRENLLRGAAKSRGGEPREVAAGSREKSRRAADESCELREHSASSKEHFKSRGGGPRPGFRV